MDIYDTRPGIRPSRQSGPLWEERSVAARAFIIAAAVVLGLAIGVASYAFVHWLSGVLNALGNMS